MKYTLKDLIDIEHFQALQDRLNEIYAFPSSIIDNDGNILTATAWQDICTQFHRKNKDAERICIKSDQYIKEHIHEANPALSYRCPHGLVDNATPIIIEGVHYGNFFTGQFLLEPPDIDFFRAQAQKYGFDEKAYLRALNKVPIWTQEQLTSYLFFIKGLIAVISESGLKKLKEEESRKKIEKSEKRYRSILKAAMDGYWVTDTQGRLLEVNDAYCQMSGYSEDELLNMHIFDLEFIETPDRVAERMQKVILKGSDRFETKHRRKDGSVFDIEASVQFRPEDAGQCVCFLRDITNKKQADQALRESEERYRQHFSQFPVPIFVWKRRNDRFMLTGCNEAADSITDSQVTKLIGITADQLYDDDDSAHLYETLATCYRERRTIRKEFEYRLKTTGRKMCISGSWVYVAPDTVMLHTEDITERRMAELALRESEEKFRNFTEQSFVGFYIIQDGLFTYVNPKFADIFGYTVEECMNHMHFRQLVHTEDLATVQEQVRRREAGEIDTADYTFRGVKKNGEIIHVSIYGSSLIYRGRPAAIGTMLDITKALEMEERVAQSQRMEAIGSLAGGIAHDFNNILFPIIGMAELLVEDLSPGSLEHANASEIYNAGLRGRDLVKQILAFSRQSEHRMIPTRAQSVLKEVIKLSRSTIPSNIDIQEDIQPDCGFIMADPTQIHQVAMNIITNAYHAVEDDGGTISIHLKETVLADTDLPDPSVEPDKPVLHLRISDTGHGIRKDHMDKIFDPYFTTKGQEKGTGLGLAVVHGIVKEHGGVIEVTSEPGKGSTFHIYLPVMEQKDAAEQTGEVEELLLGNEHILLVDDEEATAMIEKQMLERLGYTVTERHSSRDALKAFKSKPDAFDLLITDMTMPNMTGDRLAKEIKSIRSTMPVIICTGFSEKMNPEKAEKAGISGLLMKPVGKTDMGKMVRKVLDAAKEAAVD